jgi:hypothetical protein
MTSNDAHMWLAPMKVSTLSGGPVSADDPNGYLTIRLGPGEVEVTGVAPSPTSHLEESHHYQDGV